MISETPILQQQDVEWQLGERIIDRIVPSERGEQERE